MPPLNVRLSRVPEAPLVAGRQYIAECEVVGARPPPAVTWRIGQQPPLPQAEVTVSTSHGQYQSVTVSTSHGQCQSRSVPVMVSASHGQYQSVAILGEHYY